MRKYFAVFKFNLKSELNFKVDYIFSLLSFAMHIFIFNALWDYILKDSAIEGFTRAGLIWYIIVGEFIAYSIGKKSYIKVSDMIKNGEIANILSKPLSFMKYVIALEATSIVNIAINFVFAIILGLCMGGVLHVELLQLILFAISLIFALVLVIMVFVFIGLMAFLTEENKSFYLVISKTMLLLVFTPLEFFPNIMQRILSFLPTTYIVYPPGSILVNYNLNSALMLILGQIISLIVVGGAVYLLNVKGVRSINVNGG